MVDQKAVDFHKIWACEEVPHTSHEGYLKELRRAAREDDDHDPWAIEDLIRCLKGEPDKGKG
eukprot:5361277-Pyramimonas_sp.AAC.1